MKNILHVLALPFITLAFFVVPGEARAWSQVQNTPEQNVIIQSNGQGWSSQGWRNGVSFDANVIVPVSIVNRVSLSNGKANYTWNAQLGRLVPTTLSVGDTISVTNFPLNTFQLSGTTRTLKNGCTDNNSGYHNSYYYLGSASGTGKGLAGTYVGGFAGWLFCVGYSGIYGQVGGEPQYWTLDTTNLGEKVGSVADTVAVISPQMTVTSSNPSAISCSGLSCTVLSGGAANISVSFSPTVANLWGDVNFSVTIYGGGVSVPAATAVSVPVTVITGNQPPTAVITSPAAPSSTITQGDSLVFRGTGTDPELGPIIYEWTYGSCGGQLISSNQAFDLGSVAGFPTGPSAIYFRVQDDQNAWSPCDSRTVTVNLLPPPAPIFSFYPNATMVNYGSAYNLIWNNIFDATSCTASGDWSGNKTIAGDFELMPAITTTQTHTLSCTGPGGTTTKTVYVAPITSPPSFAYFAANPMSVNVGDNTVLRWNVVGPGVITCNASAVPGNALWSGSKPTVKFGAGFATSPLFADTTFTLTCSNAWGSVNKSKTVTVIGGSTTSTCDGNGVCEGGNGENPLTCPKDCKVKYKQF